MKLSISLPDEDVSFLDAYARDNGQGSRSAALRKAVQLLRASQLGDAYAAAWDDWDNSDESGLWEGPTGDGVASS